MIDLHSHILPGVDDGPAALEESVRLVRMELEDGVETIAATPHFMEGRESVVSFISRRDAALDRLWGALQQQGIKAGLVAGAEVFLSPEVLRYRHFRSLCYAGTAYMLVELPCYYQPGWISDVFYELRAGGITPVLAHVERYDYLMGNPNLLFDLVAGGALIQTNAQEVAGGSRRVRSSLFRLMAHGLVHLIATDTHSVQSRPPDLRRAMDAVTDRYGIDKAEFFNENSRCVVENRFPQLPPPRRVKGLFHGR